MLEAIMMKFMIVTKIYSSKSFRKVILAARRLDVVVIMMTAMMVIMMMKVMTPEAKIHP